MFLVSSGRKAIPEHKWMGRWVELGEGEEGMGMGSCGNNGEPNQTKGGHFKVPLRLELVNGK